MLKNYLTTALRNFSRNKANFFLHIIGLSVGMAVAMLIGFWIWDEVTHDKYNTHYDRVGQVMQNINQNGGIDTWGNVPYPLAEELRSKYGSNFKQVVLTTGAGKILTYGDKQLRKEGIFAEEGAPELFDLRMLKGTRNGLQDPHSILLSQSTAQALFGEAEPIGRMVRIDTGTSVKVTGVYADLPANSRFARTTFLVPWQLRLQTEAWIKGMNNPWGSNFTHVFVQLAERADFKNVSVRIKDAKLNNVHKDELAGHAQLFLYPMREWNLYDDFENGINSGGRITYVRMFAIIGIFVLMLACINFMNLSTARSEQRAKEVGVRKAVGSLRRQLIGQFLAESVLLAALAGVVAILLVWLCLPLFNSLADKKVLFPWGNLYFWLSILGFLLFTGLLAGSYPAFYLSGFRASSVLKGNFRVGSSGTLPRKILVVVQFTVSIALIIGTLIVFRQIEYAKDRSVGYNSSGLLYMQMHTSAIADHFEAVRSELKNAGAIEEMAQSMNPITDIWSSNGGLSWKGKDPSKSVDLPMSWITYDFGKTVGWKIVQGRDFSRDFSATDSSAFILNESAVKFMGLQHPIGETIYFNDGFGFKVVGVVKDMVMESPFYTVRPTLFRMSRQKGEIIHIRLRPGTNMQASLDKVRTVFSRYNPYEPFEYTFVDEEYGKKFAEQQRIGKLAGVFASLAIFISCLGLFGLAAFVAGRRTREVGVRKVLGASLFQVWSLLTRDFVILVLLSAVIAMPLAWYVMRDWLRQYTYRTQISWGIFAVTFGGALLLTLLTVSYQAIRAGLTNPAKSLRTE